jgi:hypothetical protein
MRRIVKAIQYPLLFSAVNLTVFAVTFFLIEGLASTAFVVHETFLHKSVAESFHTQYDEEIGWINKPAVLIEDLYGKGKHVRTNSQRFRNDKDFDEKVDPNKIRIVCSGDSFTFGYGVGNDHAWCQLLSSMDAGIETVNMGQGGYGVDQAYLWYRRHNDKIEHDIHLFAFITEDFRRMERNNHLGYGKPVLEVRDGVLTTKNVPVPRRGFYVPWLTQVLEGLRKLNSYRLLSGLYERTMSWRAGNNPHGNDDQKSAVPALKVFDELARINRDQKSILVLVYLPIEGDYLRSSSDSWRRLISTHAAKEKILYMDLIQEFRTLSPEQVRTMFIGRGVLDYCFAEGHYTEAGNAYIAKALHRKLLSGPEIIAKRRSR